MYGDCVDEIQSNESVQSGKLLLALYDWKGFGFEVRAISDEYQGEVVFLNNANTRQDEILVNIEGTQHNLRLEGDTLTAEQ